MVYPMKDSKKPKLSRIIQLFTMYKLLELLGIGLASIGLYELGRWNPLGLIVYDNSILSIWSNGSITLFIMIFILLAIAAIIYFFIMFIKSNWNLAKRKAREELNG